MSPTSFNLNLHFVPKDLKAELQEAIYELFDFSNFEETKEICWQLLQAAACKTYDHLEPFDRQHIFLLHKKLERVLIAANACNEIYRNKKDR